VLLQVLTYVHGAPCQQQHQTGVVVIKRLCAGMEGGVLHRTRGTVTSSNEALLQVVGDPHKWCKPQLVNMSSSPACQESTTVACSWAYILTGKHTQHKPSS